MNLIQILGQAQTLIPTQGQIALTLAQRAEAYRQRGKRRDQIHNYQEEVKREEREKTQILIQVTHLVIKKINPERQVCQVKAAERLTHHEQKGCRIAQSPHQMSQC